MVDQLLEEGTSRRPTRSRRRVVAVVVAAVLAVAALIAGVKVAFHYAHAPALRCACGLVWSQADSRSERDSKAGLHAAMNVVSRAPKRQSFFVEIDNPASVTQTFLGLGDDQSGTVWRGVLAISTRPNFPSDKTDEQLDYTTRAVDIPPGGQYTLRYTFTASPCMRPGAALVFESLDVKVRTGWFTHVETIDFAGDAFVVKGTKASAHAPGC